jgi:hypothetical protein
MSPSRRNLLWRSFHDKLKFWYNSVNGCKVWCSLRFFLSFPFLQAWFISFVFFSLYRSDFTAFLPSYLLILSLVTLSVRLPSFLSALSFHPLLLFYLAFFPFSSHLILWLFFIFIQTAFTCFLSFNSLPSFCFDLHAQFSLYYGTLYSVSQSGLSIHVFL